MKTTILASVLVLSFIACQKENTGSENAKNSNELDPRPPASDKISWWQPKVGVSFDWQLDDLKNGDTFTADVVDVDAFTTTIEQVAALHAQGKKVIAYLSVGTIENDRPDVSLLPQEVIGQVYPEWPKERWLDIKQLEKLKPWLNSRFNMIIKKGFDAIEPDNLDGHNSKTGFVIGLNDAKKYCDYLIKLAHENGLGIGQKNVPELSIAYSEKFDWALTEDAFNQGWQKDLKPYTDKNKPVFAVEYTNKTSEKNFSDVVCPQARLLKYTAILKKKGLDKWVYKCQ